LEKGQTEKEIPSGAALCAAKGNSRLPNLRLPTSFFSKFSLTQFFVVVSVSFSQLRFG
jgi:hypothetical protein